MANITTPSEFSSLLGLNFGLWLASFLALSSPFQYHVSINKLTKILNLSDTEYCQEWGETVIQMSWVGIWCATVFPEGSSAAQRPALCMGRNSPPRVPLWGYNQASSKQGSAELSSTLWFMIAKHKSDLNLQNQREADTEHGMEQQVAIYNAAGWSLTWSTCSTYERKMEVLAKWKRSLRKGYELYDCHHVTFWKSKSVETGRDKVAEH